MNRILDVSPRDSIREFLGICDRLGFDANLIYGQAQAGLDHLRGSKIRRARTQVDRSLELRWYASIDEGKPDFSVYDGELYMAELWACWVIYSRKYLQGMYSGKSLESGSILSELGSVSSVVDLGCGIAYSTAAFTSMFPSARIIGTNLADTMQCRFGQEMAKRYGFELLQSYEEVGEPVDLVFASEYFEHFEKPVHHLRDVISTLQPKAILYANTFGSPSVGHFRRYLTDGKYLDGRATSRQFSNTLKDTGYEKIKTKLWNNRPAFWIHTGPTPVLVE